MSERDERMPRPAGPAEAPTVAGASDDVTVADSAALPGEHRGGFQREFTEPVPITETTVVEPESHGSGRDDLDVPDFLK